MKKFIKITLSLVLAVILLATAMPIYAVEDDSIKEVEELREENVKHFEMPDGTFKAIVYSEPVHRKDADGKWQDIDNTLSSEKENGNTNYSSFDGRIKFSKNVKNANGKILELSENGYKISFTLIDENIKSTSADVKNHKGKKTPTIFDSEREKLDKLQSVDNLTKVRYNDIRKGIDLEYEIYSNNIKESIIVNSKQSDYVYKFELKLNKLSAILNEDGSISLIDEKSGEEKYTMPAPFMFDDSGELSNNVYYTLTQNGKYKYELTVTADKEWINDSGRNFPVTIDPTLDATNCYYEEAYVSSSNPYSNYSKPSDGRLFVGSTKRIFLKFELPTISEEYSITSAYLIMHFYFYASMYGSMSIGAYSVPYSWNENTITWNNSVASHQSADNSATILSTNDISSNMSATEYLPMFLPFEVTEAVNDWYMGEDNNGIAIKRMSGMTNDIAFEGYNSALYNIPVLEIDYQVQKETFYIRNAESNKYIQNNGTNASLQSFDGQIDQKWEITYLNSGYAKIISKVNGLALTFTNGNITFQQYNSLDSQKWNITKVTNKYYKISPKSNASLFVSGSGDSVITDISQTTNNDEWIFYEYAPNHSFVQQEESRWCWIACVLNFADCFIDTDCTQSKIAEACRGQRTDTNYNGNSIDITNAFNYIFGSTNLYKMVFRATEENYDPDNHNEDSDSNDRVDIPAEDIEEILSGDNPCPIILGADGHVVLVYDCSKDESGRLELLIYDPTQIGTNYYSTFYNDIFDEEDYVVDYFLTLDYENS